MGVRREVSRCRCSTATCSENVPAGRRRLAFAWDADILKSVKRVYPMIALGRTVDPHPSVGAALAAARCPEASEGAGASPAPTTRYEN